jgi:serine/threonine kinase 32
MGCFLSLDNKSEHTNLRQFRLERVIGKGGFGKVNAAVKLRGEDRGAMYALKQLSLKSALKTKKSEAMLYNERNILAQLSIFRHRRLANLHYAFFDELNCYVALDLALGGDLLYQSGQQKKLRFSESCTKFYAAQMAEALIFLHSHNIIHRDIKPENILLLPNGYIRLTDFGISAIVTTDHPFCHSRSGTKGFMAYEIYEGEHGFAADLFALGVTLFFLATGKHPFLKLPPTNWEDTEHLSSSFRKCLTDLMHKDVTKRISTAEMYKTNPWFGNTIEDDGGGDGGGGSGSDDASSEEKRSINWLALKQGSLVPEFIPNLKVANCDTGHHDATDALFAAKEKPPELSIEQSKCGCFSFVLCGCF